jgi:hypothetical protein
MSRPEIPYLKPGETLMSRPDIANQVIAEFNRWQKCAGKGNIEVEHSESGIRIRRKTGACVVATWFSDNFNTENGGVPASPYAGWANWKAYRGLRATPAEVQAIQGINPSTLDSTSLVLSAGLGTVVATGDFEEYNTLILKNGILPLAKGRYTLTFEASDAPDLAGTNNGDGVLGILQWTLDGSQDLVSFEQAAVDFLDNPALSWTITAGDGWQTYSVNFEVLSDVASLSLGFAFESSTYDFITPARYTYVYIDNIQIINRCPFN